MSILAARVMKRLGTSYKQFFIFLSRTYRTSNGWGWQNCSILHLCSTIQETFFVDYALEEDTRRGLKLGSPECKKKPLLSLQF